MTKSSEIIDPWLWRDAQNMSARHDRPDKNHSCSWRDRPRTRKDHNNPRTLPRRRNGR